MSIVVDAVYENGVLKPAQPLPLAEHDKVRVTIENQSQLTPIVEAYGIAGWKGGHAALEPFALDPELDPQEGP